MKISIFLLVLAILQNVYAQSTDDLVLIAKDFVNMMAKGDFQTAAKSLDESMKPSFSPKRLELIWRSLISRVGKLEEQTAYRTERLNEYVTVYVTCKFEMSMLDIKVVFNSTKHISGLWFAPSEISVKYETPGYVNPNSFREQEVLVGNGDFTLPGSLTIPSGTGQFPGLVLIHSFGPNDRDETAGQNKPFRDLAWGLASRGIAVLRYEKRTRQHAEKMIKNKDEITIKEEVIDDAIAGISLLRKIDQIDTSNIFVLGHGLGGMLIPMIGHLDEDVTGFIIMAGASRNLEDITIDQASYIVSLDDQISKEESRQLQNLKEQAAKVKDPELLANTKSMLLGLPVKYWLSLRGYNPPEKAVSLKQPILVLQGERDYNVTIADFDGWKKYLLSQRNVEFKSYPKLNHFFIEGEGRSSPQEYQKAGHIPEYVIDDIEEWVKRSERWLR